MAAGPTETINAGDLAVWVSARMDQLERDLDGVKKRAKKAGEEASDQHVAGWRKNLGKLNGLFKAVGAAIAGFFLVQIVGAMARGTAAAVRFFGAQVTHAENLIRSYLRLSSAAKLFGVDQQLLIELAQRGRREFQMTATAANEIAVQVAKMASKAGDATRSQELLTRALDLGAAQGMSAAEVNVALEQTMRGLDEGTDKLLQMNPSQIYEEWARANGKTAASMSDLEKKQALLNAIISAGALVQGEYQRQLEGNLGGLQSWRNRLQAAREEIGAYTIPATVNLAQKLEGPLASAVSLLTGLVTNFLDPLEQLAVKMQQAGVAAEHIVPLELLQRMKEAREEVEDLAEQIEEARRPRDRGRASGTGMSAMSRDFTGLSLEQLRRERTAQQQELGEAARTGDVQRIRTAEMYLEQLNEIIALEQRREQLIRATTANEQALEEAITRSEQRSRLEEIEAEILQLNEVQSVASNARVAQLEAEADGIKRALGLITDGTAEAAETVDAEAEERLQKARDRADEMQRDIVGRLTALTATATDDLRHALAQLRRDAEETFEAAGREIPADVLAAFEALERQISSTGALEMYQRSFEELGDEVSDFALNELQMLYGSLERYIETLEEGTTAHEDASQLLKEIDERAESVAGALNEQSEAAKDARREMQALANQETINNLRDTARTIEENARAALQLAEALGLIDSNAARAIEGLIQVGANAARVAAGDVTAIPGLIGGIAQTVGSLFSNKDEERERRRRHYERITSEAQLIRALEELTGAVVTDMTAGERERALAAGQRMQERFAAADENPLGLEFRSLRVRDAEELAELMRLQEATGITFIEDGNKVMRAEFEAALDKLEEMGIGVFGDTLEGRIDGLNWKFGLLGDEAGDAAAQLQELVDILLNTKGAQAFGQALQAAMAAGGADAFIDGLVERLASGDQSLFAAGGIFEGMTAEQAQRVLEETQRLLEEGGGVIGGGGDNVARLAVNLTEAQGSQLIALGSTQVYHLAAIHALLSGSRAPEPTSIAAPLPATLGAGGGITIESLQVTVEAPGGDGKSLVAAAPKAGALMAEEFSRRISSRHRAAGGTGRPFFRPGTKGEK
ncbi:MAG TPA: hypothetical protein VD838_21125 [Anaeromyxobacteraceae bacterium]|nr:hypothetical protein [Anaeromyxobacteraceae bacterium]